VRVAIIDSGTDLQKLYRGECFDYEAAWIKVERITYSAIASCDLLIIPPGSDNTLLRVKQACLQEYLRRGGWIFCFDGLEDGLIDGLNWVHTTTNYRTQAFRVPDSDYSFLLDGVSLEDLACKNGVRGWWCEGELLGDAFVPLLLDDRGRVVAVLKPAHLGSGVLVATAAGRLPIYSEDPALAPNVFFSNLLAYCRAERRKPSEPVTHLFVHSGNWAHRSFLNSDEFGSIFSGVHWSCLDRSLLAGASSIWIPWESNTGAMKRIWPLLDSAVNSGTGLVVEDLRGDWIPDVRWHPRPVDSSWWREGRSLDLLVEPVTETVFPSLSRRAFFWHYHGAFDCPADAIPLLRTSDGKTVLAVRWANPGRQGHVLVSTLDATFEFGVGKIEETKDYIHAVVSLLEHAGSVDR
jgi:hypothetical protein